MAEQVGEPVKLDWPGMYEGGFAVLRDEPSLVARELVSALGQPELAGRKVLDLGCGTLRNAVYFVQLGADVEAIDVVEPVEALSSLGEGIRPRINFQTLPVQDYQFEPDSFDLVACTRLLQYLPAEDCENLLQNAARVIKSGGGLALNYTVKGGLVGDQKSPVETFSHDPNTVVDSLRESGLKIHSMENLNPDFSARAPFFEAPERNPFSCDIVAVKAQTSN